MPMLASMPPVASTLSPDVGALVISLDFELHWGVRDQQPLDAAERRRLLAARQAIPELLALLVKHRVAATWATVGMLFARSHAELEAYRPTILPQYDDPTLAPEAETVGAGEQDDPFHYAPALIAAIARSPRQEIASHTFAHCYGCEPGQSEAAFRADLHAAVAIASAQGMQLRALALPRNQFNPSYRDAVRAAGFRVYRGNERHRIYAAAARAQKQRLHFRLARLIDAYLPLSGEHLTPWAALRTPDGLCNLPASRFLRAYTPALRPLGALQLRRITRGIVAAAQTRQIYHLWWHPEDFADHTAANLAFLDEVLSVFTQCRRTYGMQSLTMTEAAEQAALPTRFLGGRVREGCALPKTPPKSLTGGFERAAPFQKPCQNP